MKHQIIQRMKHHILQRVRGKPITMEWLAHAIFMANDYEYLARNPMVKAMLIKREKLHPADSCICCIFFKWDQDGGPYCAVRQNGMLDSKELIYEKRQSGCPLDN